MRRFSRLFDQIISDDRDKQWLCTSLQNLVRQRVIGTRRASGSKLACKRVVDHREPEESGETGSMITIDFERFESRAFFIFYLVGSVNPGAMCISRHPHSPSFLILSICTGYIGNKTSFFTVRSILIATLPIWTGKIPSR